jgi:HK97 family phage portal protein
MWPFKKKQVKERAEAVNFDEVLLQAILNKGSVSLDEAMEIPSFAGCVNKICDTISIIPIKLYEKKEDGVIEVLDDDRVDLINIDTRDTLTGPDFKKALVRDYLTSKGGYAFINKHGSRFISLNYVESDKVSFLEGVDPIFKDYKVMVNGRFYEPFQFLKICRSTKNGYKGTSIVEEANLALTVVYTSLKFEGKLVKRGGNKKGFLESEKKLDNDAITALKEGFNKMYSDDNENAIVLNNGVKFHESSNSSTEMQLNENKKANSTEICKLFNMPPEIINGGATEEHKKQYVQFCIIPILEAITKALNKELLLDKEIGKKYFDFDVSDLTKADIKTRYEAYAIGYKNRFLQISEIRKMENLSDIDIPFFMMGLNDVLYDPESGDIFIPNMNQFANVKDPSKYPAREGNSNVPAAGDAEDTENTENEEEKDESKDKS